MVISMASVKVTVTVDEEQLRRIRLLVDQGAVASVSGFFQQAVTSALDETAAWATLLSQALTETGGPLTDEERAWADSVLGTRKKSPTEAGNAA